MKYLLIPLIAILGSCNDPSECPCLKDLKEHKLDHKYAWIKNTETLKVYVTDKCTGKVVCTFRDLTPN